MSSRQLEVCAARMPPVERLQFLQLVAESTSLFREALTLRREAWELYRETTGLKKQPSPKKVKR